MPTFILMLQAKVYYSLVRDSAISRINYTDGEDDASSVDAVVREETSLLDKASPKTKKILVVDDDRDLLQHLKLAWKPSMS